MKDIAQRKRLLESRIDVLLSETKLYIKNNNVDPESMTLGDVRIFADFLSSEYSELITSREIISMLTAIACG